MKKITAFLIAIMLLCLCACGEVKENASLPDASSLPASSTASTDNSPNTDSDADTDIQSSTSPSPEVETPSDTSEINSSSEGDGSCKHVFLPPSCTEPEKCGKCGLTRGKPSGHLYSSAACTTPEKCKRCGEKSGEAIGHDFKYVSCTKPLKCTRCGIEEGEALGHKWSSEKCERCKATVQSTGDKIKVVCVGDSITNNGYWKNNLYGGLGDTYEVVGLGVNGATGLLSGLDVGSPKPYMSQTFYQASLDYAPNAVVIMLGTNDSKPCNFDKIKADGGAQYKKDMIKLVDSYKALASEPVIFIALPPTVFRNNTAYEGISEASLTSLIIPILKQVASETGAIVIDTHTATKNAEAHFKDNVHPSDDAGRKLIADTVAAAILKKYK